MLPNCPAFRKPAVRYYWQVFSGLAGRQVDVIAFEARIRESIQKGVTLVLGEIAQ